ncbi:MAG: hypothetical protein K2X27_22060 [Candidatus Obscuribacterales bacterium]|nr:hypothetical protein [Candidatus Obscuribacterales bacterium]
MDNIDSELATKAAKKQEIPAERLQLSHSALLSSKNDALSLKNAILAPTINTLVVEPLQAINTITNLPAEFGIGNKQKWSPNPISQIAKPFLSSEWFLQGLSSGISSALVFATTKRLFVSGSKALGFTARDSYALLASGSLYEALKDPKKGESRLSNAAGGFAMLGTFEVGNMLLRNKSALKYYSGQFVLGIAGAVSHEIPSLLLNPQQQESIFKTEQLLSGGIFNVTLSALTRSPIKPAERSIETSAKSEARDQAKPVDSIKNQEKTSTPEKIESPETSPLNKATVKFTPLGDQRVEIWRDNGSDTTFSNLEEYFRDRAELVPETMKAWLMEPQNLMITVSPWPAEYSRLTLKELGQVALTIPAPGLIKSITVIDTPHHMEAWNRFDSKSPNLKIHGSIKNQELRLYQPDSVSDTSKTANHEFSHSLKEKSPQESALFDAIERIERIKLPDSDKRDLSSSDEKWAHLGEILLTEPPELAKMTAYINPAHSVVFANALRKAIQNDPSSKLSTSHKYHLELIEFINLELLEKALRKAQSNPAILFELTRLRSSN